MATVAQNAFAEMLFGNSRILGPSKISIAKSLLDEHTPYVKENDANHADYVVMLQPHFKQVFIDALSWDDTDFDMSKSEINLYRLFSKWAVGDTDLSDPRYNEKLKAVNAMDSFVVQEIYNRPCTSLKTLETAANRLGLTGNTSGRYSDMSNYNDRVGAV